MEDNKRIWNKLKTPPASALKEIIGGRLKGMTDIKPQWRYDALTDTFGPCGEGWNYTIEKLWIENGIEGQVFAFALVQFKYKEGEEWSEPIPGIGGSMLIEKDKWGLHHNDEAFKMAVTDALSVAVKMIGVGSDIYMGNAKGDGGKYNRPEDRPKQPSNTNNDKAKKPARDWIKEIESAKDENKLRGIFAEAYSTTDGEEKAKVKMAYDKKKQEFKGE